MERVTNEDFDSLRLRVKRKFASESCKSQEAGENRQDFQLGFSIRIPDGFARADEKTAEKIYWSQRRPTVILLTGEGKAGITFQALEEELQRDDLFTAREIIRGVLSKLDPRTVVYDTGEEGEALWFDYKSFAGNETVYNLVFLFQGNEKKILGSFYCSFEAYDRWRPEVLDMLNTIETKENAG